MDTITKGRLGYNLTEQFLLKHNFEIYTPILENTKIDCIAAKNNKLYKIQIKTIQDSRYARVMPVRKLSNNRGTNKQKHYTKDDVDFFFGVDLKTNDIYVVPISIVIKYNSAISISSLEQYKNNYNIIV